MNDFKKEAEEITKQMVGTNYSVTGLIETALREAYEKGIEDAASLVRNLHPIGLKDVAEDILSLKRPVGGEK